MKNTVRWKYGYNLLIEDNDYEEFLEYKINPNFYIRRGNKRIKITRRSLSLILGVHQFYHRLPGTYCNLSSIGYSSDIIYSKSPHRIKL